MSNLGITEIRARFENNEDMCRQVIHLFDLLSNKTRFRILCMLLEGDFCVNDIVETICCGGLSAVSQHLRILALSDVVERKRDHQRIIYSLKDERLRKLIRYLEKELMEGGQS